MTAEQAIAAAIETLEEAESNNKHVNDGIRNAIQALRWAAKQC